jgi:hypothetical protein
MEKSASRQDVFKFKTQGRKADKKGRKGVTMIMTFVDTGNIEQLKYHVIIDISR